MADLTNAEKAEQVYDALRWTPIYLGTWSGYEDMIGSFRPYDWDKGGRKAGRLALQPEEHEVIYANYEQGNYDGRAFVIYQKDGKLYEVHGSHCSCNGLEECWSPEETSWAAIAMRRDTWEGLIDVIAEHS
jgi:hypothetical protein